MNQKRDNQPRYTSDFNSMIRIVIWSSMGFFFLGFIIPIVAKIDLNATGTEIGLITSVQVLGYTLSSPLVGAITDRSSKTKLILIGSFGRGSAYFLVYIGLILKSIPIVACGTFSIGFMVGFFWIPFDTLTAFKSNKNNRSNAYGKRDSAMGKGAMLGALIGFGIFIWGNNNVPSSLYLVYLAIPIFGVFNFIAGILFLKNVDESIKFQDGDNPVETGIELNGNENNNANKTEINTINKKSTNSSAKKTLLSRQLLIGMSFLMIVLLLANINGMIARPFLQLYILQYIINDPNIAVLIYLPSSIVSLFFAPKLGELVDKVRPSIGITVASIIGAFATWLIINTTNPLVFSLILVLDSTIFNTATLVIMNFLSRISLKNRGKIMGLQSVFSNLGGVIGPIVGGIAWDAIGLKSPFIISIFVELALIPIYLIAIHFVKPHIIEKYEFKESLEEDQLKF